MYCKNINNILLKLLSVKIVKQNDLYKLPITSNPSVYCCLPDQVFHEVLPFLHHKLSSLRSPCHSIPNTVVY